MCDGEELLEPRRREEREENKQKLGVLRVFAVEIVFNLSFA
jgi:hypothetical protein